MKISDCFKLKHDLSGKSLLGTSCCLHFAEVNDFDLYSSLKMVVRVIQISTALRTPHHNWALFNPHFLS